MDYSEKPMRILSNINCGLASATTFLQQKANGVNSQYATMNLLENLANGISRNEVAYEMQKYGNPTGNMINMYAGYGNPISNAVGTMGLIGACTPNPWMFFNSYSFMCPPMPMMGGFYSNMGMGFNFGAPHCCHRGFFC